MRSVPYLYFLVIMFLASCQPGATSEKSGEVIVPAGKFLNKAILDACPSKMPVDIPHFVMEMNFRPGDTTVHSG